MRHYLRSLLIVAFLGISNSSLLAKTYHADYVVVGVGTAGAVVAKELTDDKKTSLVALHSGKNLSQNPNVKFSKNVVSTVASGLVDSTFFQIGESTPQEKADNRKLPWGIGRPEGGDSAINAGAWARGTNEVYAQWESIAGSKWSVKHITAIYKELENYHGLTDDPAARGVHGPLSIRQVQHPTTFSQKFTEAIIAATGFPFVLDYNDPKTPIGASTQLQYTQKGPHGALRVSSATAFLNRNVVTPSGYGVDGRKLRVLYKSYALKTLWKNKKAVGVEFLRHGKRHKILANKGVIVCGGLFSSSFLMHSGVGPRKLLDSLKIPVIFDQPNVGHGLADQCSLILTYTTNPADTPLYETNSLFAQIAWLPDPTGDPKVRQVRFAGVNLVPGIAQVFLDLIQPKSRGNITINSADPTVPPVINFGELTAQSDLDLFMRALKIYVKNINQALQAIDPLYKLVYPSPAILNDDEALIAFIKEEVQSTQCFQSHCRMARFSEGGVVNNRGEVYGVGGLWIADDSIVPKSMDGTPMATAYLIAKNISHFIMRRDKKHCRNR